MNTQTLPQGEGALDRLLNSVRDALTPEVARRIVNLRADSATQDRLEDLADRHHEGQLSAEELAEYEELVNGINLISILQIKAKSLLEAAS